MRKHSRPKMHKLYISDNHFGHTNIIRYTNRPFSHVDEMDRVMMDKLREAEASGGALYHLGDFSFKISRVVARFGGFEHPERHVLLPGNHDRVRKERELQAAHQFFGTVAGHEKMWRDNTLVVEDEVDGKVFKVLLSHMPQKDLRGCDVNLYGHTHNTAQKDPPRFKDEHPWLAAGLPTHFNVCVEHLNYQPRSLKEIFRMRQDGFALL